MKKIYLIAAGIMLALLLILLLVSPTSSSFYTSKPIAENVQHASSIEGDLYYFSNNYFQKISKDNKVTRLTPYFNYPDILDIKWSERGALFNTTGYKNTDSFSRVLDEKLLSTDDSHWWYIDFSSGKVSLIENPMRPLLRTAVGWHKNGASYFVAAENRDDAGSTTTLYLKESGSDKTINTVKPEVFISDVLWGDDNTVLVETLKDEKEPRLSFLSLRDGKISEIDQNTSGSVSVNKDASAVLYSKNSESANNEGALVPPRDLFLWQKDKKKSRRLIEDFEGRTTWSSMANSFIIVGGKGNDEYVELINENLERKQYQLKGSTSKPLFVGLKRFSPLEGFMVDSESNLYTASESKDAPVPDLPKDTEFVGFQQLTNYGLTKFQLSGLEYLLENNPTVKEEYYSLQDGTIQIETDDLLAQRRTYGFKFDAGSEEYIARLIAIRFSEIQLTIYRGSSIIYESPNFDITSLTVR